MTKSYFFYVCTAYSVWGFIIIGLFCYTKKTITNAKMICTQITKGQHLS